MYLFQESTLVDTVECIPISREHSRRYICVCTYFKRALSSLHLCVYLFQESTLVVTFVCVPISREHSRRYICVCTYFKRALSSLHLCVYLFQESTLVKACPSCTVGLALLIITVHTYIHTCTTFQKSPLVTSCNMKT